MAFKVYGYPVLNKKLLTNIELKYSDTTFSYDKGKTLMTEKLDSHSFSIIDNNYQWNKEKDEFCIEKKYTINKPNLLFGCNGIAPSNAVIGAAVIWSSYDSKQRGVIKFGKITNQEKPLSLELSHTFEKAQFRGAISFKTILYIEKKGIKKNSEEFLANKTGLYLGTLVEPEFLYLDGSASLFPIYEIELEKGPLWTVSNSCRNPSTDLFNETISINLNKCNKDYEKLKIDKSLMIEVFTSALITIIADIRIECSSDWKSIEKNESLGKGSVGAALYYFKNTLGWNFDSMKELSVSIRNFLKKNFKDDKHA